ncbi:MAG: hypothetical protein LBG59_07165 [Candidatus Peribacteria bacterium]|jgi:hypothetical protein|nr:hypothetical protein [Candidatus Peribacteria bacterium]
MLLDEIICHLKTKGIFVYCYCFILLVTMSGTYLGQNFLKDGTIRHWIAEKVEKTYHTLKAQ